MLNSRHLFSPLKLLLTTAAFLAICPLHAAGTPYILVFSNGRQVETKSAPVERDGKSYFRTMSGQEFVVKTGMINASRTRFMNEQLALNPADDILVEDTPANNSLGRVSEQNKQDRIKAVSAPPMVGSDELNRVRNNDTLQSPDRITPENATPVNDTSEIETTPGQIATPTTGADGTTTFTVTIPQPQPAPQPAQVETVP